MKNINQSNDTVFVIESSHGVLALSGAGLQEALKAGSSIRSGLNGQTNDTSRSTRTRRRKLLTAKELAKRINVGPSWLLRRARENRIPHVRMGKYVRFDASEVLECLRKNANRHANS